MFAAAKRLARAQPRPGPTPKTIAVSRDGMFRSLHSLGWPLKDVADGGHVDRVMAASADDLPENLFLPGLAEQDPEDHQMRNKYEGCVERIDIPEGS